MLKNNRFWPFLLSSIIMTSCVNTQLCEKKQGMACQEVQSFEIPCQWYTPLESNMSVDDPESFRWWEALHDPLLNNLIEEAGCRNSDVKLAMIESCEKGLDAMNLGAAEIAKTYIELRGQQQRLSVLEKRVSTQNATLTLNSGLTSTGFTSSIEEILSKQNLQRFLTEKFATELSINKLIFHLSSLLNYLPCDLYEALSDPKNLSDLPCYIPVGSPIEVLSRNNALNEAKKAYLCSKNCLTYLNYEKKFYSLLEEIESAISTLIYENTSFQILEKIYLLSQESYQLTLDLYNQGLKSDSEVLATFLDYLSNEDAQILAKIKLLQAYVSLYQTFGNSFTVCCH